MGPGALDPVTKEMIIGQCHQPVQLLHRLAHCFSAEKRHDRRHVKELMAIVGMANETNKIVTGYQVEIDPQFKK